MTVGIDNLKKSVEDLKGLIASFEVVFEDGQLSFGDLTKLPSLVSDAYGLFRDAKAAIDAGEISDISLDEAKELLTILVDLGTQAFAKLQAKA